jgi:hypothetical protein
MELKNLVYQLWEELEGMNITDDSLLNYQYLREKIIAMHPTLIKEAESQRLSLNGFYQVIPCIEVECLGHRCTVEGIPFEVDTMVYKANLPPLVKTIGRKNLRYFGIAGFGKDIQVLSMEAFRSTDGARFTSREPVAMILGDTAILKNLPSQGFQRAVITAILADPTRACDWPADDCREFPTASIPRLLIAVKRDILSAIGRPDLIHDAQIALGQGMKAEAPRQQEEAQ